MTIFVQRLYLSFSVRLDYRARHAVNRSNVMPLRRSFKSSTEKSSNGFVGMAVCFLCRLANRVWGDSSLHEVWESQRRRRGCFWYFNVLRCSVTVRSERTTGLQGVGTVEPLNEFDLTSKKPVPTSFLIFLFQEQAVLPYDFCKKRLLFPSPRPSPRRTPHGAVVLMNNFLYYGGRYCSAATRCATYRITVMGSGVAGP